MIRALNTGLRRIPAWPIYLIGLADIVRLFYLGQTGGLGPEPINALERALGQTALKLIVVGLAITPLLKFTRINLIRFRRAIGLTAFIYIVVHLSVWLLLDVALLSEIWADIVKRPYVTVGMAGFAALLPLAITSNDWSVRRLGGAGWRRLHKLTYFAAMLGAVHFVMIGKTWQFESLAYLSVVILLLAVRLKRRKPAERIATGKASA